MNNDLAIACKKDTKHAASMACIYYSENGRMVLISPLCSDGFKFILQKQNSGFLFTVYDSSETVFHTLFYPRANDVEVLSYLKRRHARYQCTLYAYVLEKERRA